MHEKPPKGNYWSTKDIDDLRGSSNTSVSASKTSLKSRKEQLETLATTRPGEIVYVGKLALAIPSADHWEKIIDADGLVIKEHLRGLPDEEIIKVVVYGERALSLYTIDAMWHYSKMVKSRELDYPDGSLDAEARYHRAAMTVGAMSDYSDKEFLAEFKARRRDRFLGGNADSNLLFEQSIRQVISTAPFYAGEIYDRIGFGSIE